MTGTGPVASTDGDGESGSGVESLVAVYRHDVHKVRSRSHEHAEAWFGGVRVNESVPLGADRDAALLSRQRGEPEQTVDAHESWYRLSLLTGETVTDEGVGDAALRDLVVGDDAVDLHAAWVSSDVAAVVSESPYYPYTSLKYHTLLAAALLENYLAGFEFDELFLAAVRQEESDGVVPHRSVLVGPGIELRVTGEPGEWPAARLGDAPARSFADVWARMPAVPFDVGGSRRWRVLDAQLRRVRSWSTALQLIEDFVKVFEPGSGDSGMSGGGSRD